jgi:predicted transport protein
LGPEWKRIQGSWLHSLGNLTLTGYNAEYSDRPFAEKRDMKGGFKDSPLRLNEGLGALHTWGEAEIQARAKRLADLAVEVWGAPSLPPEVLETYRPKVEKPSGFTIDDHPHLAERSPMRPLFEAFRREVLALDPCVTEEFLRRYVAYKAETNFVDVVPQVRRLNLSLNLKFPELYDPKGLANDVTNIGHWGNGDVEVGLNSLEGLPSIMGLVRQAFEKQMENADVGG